MVLGYGLFKKAGATGHVFFVENGKRNDKGLAYSGIYGPGTAIAVVPTIQQIVDFSVNATTSDKQEIAVNGNVKVTLTPAQAVAALDFTVDPKTGGYLNRWETHLRSLVLEQVIGPIKTNAKAVRLADIVSAQAQMEDAVTTAVNERGDTLGSKGIVIDSCSIPDIVPADEDLSDALGAREREAMLTEADDATHARQMQSVANARAVKTYESETAHNLEKERGRLVEEQSKNKLAEAESDANALNARMGPFEKLDSSKLLALAFYRMGEGGRVGTINVTPELLESFKVGLGK